MKTTEIAISIFRKSQSPWSKTWKMLYVPKCSGNYNTFSQHNFPDTKILIFFNGTSVGLSDFFPTANSTRRQFRGGPAGPLQTAEGDPVGLRPTGSPVLAKSRGGRSLGVIVCRYGAIVYGMQRDNRQNSRFFDFAGPRVGGLSHLPPSTQLGLVQDLVDSNRT